MAIMMNNYPHDCGNAGLVQKFIGTAYQTVKFVADNMHYIKTIYDMLTQYNMLACVESVEQLKNIDAKQVRFARIYALDDLEKRYIDYAFIDNDESGIKPNGIQYSGSWIKVGTSSAGTGGDGSRDIAWVYSNGSAQGGEETIIVPEQTAAVTCIYVNGNYQYPRLGFEYDELSQTIRLAQPLEEGDTVIAMLSGLPADPETPNVDNFKYFNWVYNNGKANGGEQTFRPPYNFKTVVAVFINGLRKEPQYHFTWNSEGLVQLREPVKENDFVVIQIGGDVHSLLLPNVMSGYTFKGRATLRTINDHIYDSVSKKWYQWIGVYPKRINENTVAAEQINADGGIWSDKNPLGLWISSGDANLRSELNQTFKSAVGMGLIADGVTNEKGTLDSIKAAASEDRAPVIVQTTGGVRSRMHVEPVDDLMPEQLVTLGNLKGRLDIYDPDPVPSWNEAVDGVTGGTTTINSNWLYAEWDKLVNASKGKLVRQEDIGTSQDGAYPIRQYLWVGANNPTGAPADRTLREVLVTAGIHGSETVSMLGLLYFMKDLVEKGDEIPALRWLYYNTRIRIVPVANPWGVSQLPKVRNNSRGVNLNRNFDYLWDTLPTTNPGDADYKGDAPFSESETIALRSWFGQFASRAVAYIDIHSMGIYTGNSAKAPHFVGFCSPLADPIANEIFTKFANKHTRIEILQNQNNPTSRAYATVRYGLPSITCEHTDTAWAREGASYSQAKDTSYSITGAVKMYGNVIAGFSKLAVRQLFPVFIENNNAGITIPRSDNWTQLFARNSYDAGIDGIVTVKAGIVVRNNSEVDTVVSLAIIGESGTVSGYYPYATVLAGSSVSLSVEKAFRVDKSQRKYPVSVHVLSRYSEATVIKYFMSIEPKYLGYDVGNI